MQTGVIPMQPNSIQPYKEAAGQPAQRPPTQISPDRTGWLHTLRFCQNGQSLAEMAIVLPLLLIIMAGIFDVGRSMQNYVVILNASREAALAGASAQTPVADLVSLIQNELQRGGLNTNRATISIQIQQKGFPAEDYITVEVGYQVELFFGNFGVPDLPMRAVHEMVTFW